MTSDRDRGPELVGDDDGTRGMIALRADFPAFRTWREITPGRTRFIARRLYPGPGLHPVVTDDFTELRIVLGNATSLSRGSRVRTGR